MEYTIPNLGQYGYVEPNDEFNWQEIAAFFGLLVIGCVLFYHFVIKKEDEKKDKEVHPFLT